jgi:hypothetical protein
MIDIHADRSEQLLTPQQYRALLNRRTEEMRECRAAYYEELTLLRGQLFNVKKIKKERPAIKFQVESDLELLHSIAPSKDTLRPNAANARPQLTQLKRSIMKALSDQTIKNDLALKSIRDHLEKVEKEKGQLKKHIEDLEITGKLELNRQIKDLRMSSLHLMAEAERNAAHLRAQVKSANSAKEESSRQAVSTQMHTKGTVKILFEAAMSNVNRSENMMQRKLSEMDARLTQSCQSLEKAQRILNSQALKRRQMAREEGDRRRATALEQQQALDMDVRKELELADRWEMEEIDEEMKEKVAMVVKKVALIKMAEQTEKMEDTGVVEAGRNVEEEEEEEVVVRPPPQHFPQENSEQEQLEQRECAGEDSVSAASSLHEMEDYLTEYEDGIRGRERQHDDFVQRSISVIRHEEMHFMTTTRRRTCQSADVVNSKIKMSPSPPKGRRRKTARNTNNLSPRNHSMSILTQDRWSQNMLPLASFLGFTK